MATSTNVDVSCASTSDYEAYARTVLNAADWPWPEHVVLDPAKRPRFVHTVEEFWKEVQHGSHLNEIVVFPDGVRLLGQTDALHDGIRSATGIAEGPHGTNKTAYEVLQLLDEQGMLTKLKGKVTYRRRPEDRDDVTAGSRKNSVLQPKWEHLRDTCPEECKPSVYIAELRLNEKEPCSGVAATLRRSRKSTMKATMRERLFQLGFDVRNMLFWDDFSEGTFIGAGCSGYDLHADIVPTSNIGSVFAGHKLLALWRFPDDTLRALQQHGREYFTKPLPERQTKFMERACAVGLAPPGSVYVFSGINAHAVCNVGFGAPGADGSPPLPSLAISSYEAFAGLNLDHAKAMMQVIKNHGYDAEDFDDEDLGEFEGEVADEVADIQERVLAGSVASALGVEAFQRVAAFLKDQSVTIAKALDDAGKSSSEQSGSGKRSNSEESAERAKRQRGDA